MHLINNLQTLITSSAEQPEDHCERGPVQKLPGDKDVRTTVSYTHVIQKKHFARSLLDL